MRRRVLEGRWPVECDAVGREDVVEVGRLGCLAPRHEAERGPGPLRHQRAEDHRGADAAVQQAGADAVGDHGQAAAGHDRAGHDRQRAAVRKAPDRQRLGADRLAFAARLEAAGHRALAASQEVLDGFHARARKVFRPEGPSGDRPCNAPVPNGRDSSGSKRCAMRGNIDTAPRPARWPAKRAARGVQRVPAWSDPRHRMRRRR